MDETLGLKKLNFLEAEKQQYIQIDDPTFLTIYHLE